LLLLLLLLLGVLLQCFVQECWTCPICRQQTTASFG
jgi:hypothetical protein